MLRTSCSGSVGKASFILPNKVHMCTKNIFIPSSSDAKQHQPACIYPAISLPIMRDDASTMGNEVCPFRATFPHIRGGSGVCKVIPRRHDVQGSCPRNRWNMSSVPPSWNIPWINGEFWGEFNAYLSPFLTLFAFPQWRLRVLC